MRDRPIPAPSRSSDLGSTSFRSSIPPSTCSDAASPSEPAQLELRLLIEPFTTATAWCARKIPFQDAPSAFLPGLQVLQGADRSFRSASRSTGTFSRPRGFSRGSHEGGVQRFFPSRKNSAASSQDGRGDPNRHHRSVSARRTWTASSSSCPAASSTSRRRAPIAIVISVDVSFLALVRIRSRRRVASNLPSSSARSARRYRDRRIDCAGCRRHSWMCM